MLNKIVSRPGHYQCSQCGSITAEPESHTACQPSQPAKPLEGLSDERLSALVEASDDLNEELKAMAFMRRLMANYHSGKPLKPLPIGASFSKDLSDLINRHSVDSLTGFPDLILADYLVHSIDALNYRDADLSELAIALASAELADWLVKKNSAELVLTGETSKPTFSAEPEASEPVPMPEGQGGKVETAEPATPAAAEPTPAPAV